MKLPILILYPHSRCNCRCVMCDIWKASGSREISCADLDRHAAGIRALGVEWVVLSGGEPLMHSDLFGFCARLRALGIRITALSTGLLLEAQAPEIVAHIDDLIVSLDGPEEIHDRIRRVSGAFRRMSDGVAALHRQRPDYPVAARCTVQKQNARALVATVEAARRMGLRSISFLAADLASTAFNRPGPWPQKRIDEVALDPADLEALERELALLPTDGFVLESPEKLRRIAGHFRASLGLAAFAAPRCNAPWISAVWESDGAIRPCFFHEPIGNVNEGSLRDAVFGEKGRKFRDSLQVETNPTCRKCVCSLYRP
jgi:MoaA/NifB/PqqE/SkfB family radical SAM enzyme